MLNPIFTILRVLIDLMVDLNFIISLSYSLTQIGTGHIEKLNSESLEEEISKLPYVKFIVYKIKKINTRSNTDCWFS